MVSLTGDEIVLIHPWTHFRIILPMFLYASANDDDPIDKRICNPSPHLVLDIGSSGTNDNDGLHYAIIGLSHSELRVWALQFVAPHHRRDTR